MPRCFRCSYSIRNSILSVLSINYLLSAFVGKLVGKVYLVIGEGLLVGRERAEGESIAEKILEDSGVKEIGIN